jgi:hypothetical protein
MKLTELKNALEKVDTLIFKLENGNNIAKHFHITEIGIVDKKFIDCGGTLRSERKISMQLWESIDIWHRLSPEKLISIIKIAEEKLQLEDVEIEIEYQINTIGKFGIEFHENYFILTSTSTACLAPNNCIIPANIKDIAASCCVPSSNCCS